MLAALEPLMRFSEVCKHFGISEKTGKLWLKRGDFPPAVILRRDQNASRRWHAKTVEKYLRDRLEKI